MNNEIRFLGEQSPYNTHAQVVKLHTAYLNTKLENSCAQSRFSGDLEQARGYTIEDFARKLLPIKESLESVLQTNTGGVCSNRIEIEPILNQLVQTMQELGLAEISPCVGERFNPFRHRQAKLLAVNPKNYFIKKVHRKGYLIQGQLLRPALVTVDIE